MGRLDDINNRLYQPGEEPRPEPRFFGNPHAPQNEVLGTWKQQNDPAPRAPAPRPFITKRHWIAIGLLVFGIAAGVGALFFGFEREALRVTVLTKENIEAGEKITYQIFYKNVGSEHLKDIELSFTYPPGALPLNDQPEEGKIPRTRILLSDLPKGQEGSVELEARIFGREGETKKAEAVILYRPEASTSRFVARGDVEITIVRVPLVLTVNVPQELVSGQTTTIVVDYASNAESVFEDMTLGVVYPPGFEPISFSPQPIADKSIWSLGSIAPGDSGKISVTGKVSGAPSEVKTFSAQIGRYNMLVKEWTPYQIASVGSQLSTPLLSVEQRINESRDISLKPGEDLRFRIHYKNTLDIPLKNISVEVALAVTSGSLAVDPAEVLDFRSLLVDKGFYNGTTKKIVWSPASVPEFASIPPKGEGDLSFSIRMNPLLGIDLNFSELVIGSTAEIRAQEIPAGYEGIDLSSRDAVEAKIIAKTVLSSLSLYRNQYLSNLGPLPPKVGQKTTYTVFWQLANSLNEVNDVEVRAKLSPAVSWENKFVPEGSALSYDVVSGDVIWRVGRLVAGAGGAKPAPFVAFQVGITPGLDQVGRSPLLVSNIEVRGRDAFTGESIQIAAPNITTELKGDPATKDTDWAVVK